MDTDRPDLTYYRDEEPKLFDYKARVLILDWEFSLMASGEFRIRTSNFEVQLDEEGKTSVSMRLAPSGRDLLRALLDLADEGQSVEAFPPGTKGIGIPG